MLEFSTLRKRKARKCYFCDICGYMIGSGEQYIRHSGKYEGEMFDYKQHVECTAVVNAYMEVVDGYEYDPDEVRDWICENVCSDLCTEEEYDKCLNSPFLCPKVLAKLGIKKEEEDHDRETD